MGERLLVAALTAALLGSTFVGKARAADPSAGGQPTRDGVDLPESTHTVKRDVVRPLSATRSVEFELTSKLENVNGIDNPPAGPSAGDVLIFTESLLDSGGETVGHDAAVCTRLFDATMLCNGIYVLPRGQVMVQLLQPGPTGTYDQPIVGGTGDFAGATGTVTVIQGAVGGGDRFRFCIRLDRHLAPTRVGPP